MKIAILALAFIIVSCSEHTTPAVTDDPSGLNLDFELARPTNTPIRWFLFGGESYQGILDSSSAFSGKKSLRADFVKKTDENAYFRATCTPFPIEEARGKKISYLGYIKTEALDSGYAGLWLRVDGLSPFEPLAYDEMEGRGAEGTTGWKQYRIDLPVDSGVTNITFGVIRTGNGTAWFDKLEILVDGKPYVREVFTPTDEQVAWLTQEAAPISTTLAGSGFDDLAAVRDIVGSAEIVGLGEATHGTKEFFQMKHRLIEYLSVNMGFAVFAIEANMPEAYKINEYIQGGSGNVRELLDGLIFWTWNTKEVEAMVEWMRSLNASGKGHITFTGFDMQSDSVAASNVLAFLTKHDKAYAANAQAAYRLLRTDMREAEEAQDYGNPKYAASVDAAVSILAHLLATDYENASQKEIDWTRQNATIVVQAAQNGLTDNFYSATYRDSCMAVNIRWIKDHSSPNAKVILWAHNGHIAKRDDWMMGSFLNKMYGSAYRPIGFKFHEGTYTAWSDGRLHSKNVSLPSYPGTLDWVLHSLGIPRYILNLQSTTPNDPRSGWLHTKLETKDISAMASDVYVSGQVAREFDAIVFIDKTTASECYSAEVR